MKFLDYPEFAELARQLTFESPECKVFTRLEAYSCKAVKRERQLFKSLESQYLQSASLSPPNHMDDALASPFGRLDQPAARKTLFLLIATLNGAFPDHDFSDVNPTDFRREHSSDSVLNSLGTTLLSLRSNSNAPRSFSSFPSSYDGNDDASAAGAGNSSGLGNINHPQLAAVLDDIMDIGECEVYTFHPDADSDPHACAEPDEEGELMDDDRYADDEDEISDDELGLDAGDERGDGGPRRGSVSGRSGNANMREYAYDTSTRRISFGHGSTADDDEDDDAPMFDEDLLGSGFTPVHSRISSAVTTPRTPSLSMRARASDYFPMSSKVGARSGTAAMHSPVRHRQQGMHWQGPSSMPAMPFGQRMTGGYFSDDDDMNDEPSLSHDDEDDGSGLNGLLWATYAFFYNRKLKRVLFVSVWSRRNTANLPVSYSFSPPSYPVSRSAVSANTLLAEKLVPPMSLDGAVSSTMRTSQRGRHVEAPQTDSASKQDSVTGVQQQSLQAESPSPAKRAIAKSNGDREGSRGRGRRGRDVESVGRQSVADRQNRRSMSGSPAPSTLSPFPHDAARPPPAVNKRTKAAAAAAAASAGSPNDGAQTPMPNMFGRSEPIAVGHTAAAARRGRGGGRRSNAEGAAADSLPLSLSLASSSSARSASGALSTSAKRAGDTTDVDHEIGSAASQKQRRTHAPMAS